MVADAMLSRAYQDIRPYLFSVAYRMIGSATDAEDLVHDTWMRYLDAGAPEVDSLRAYLTSIVSRLSVNYLKSARVRHEQYAGSWLPEPVYSGAALGDPEATLEQRESVSLALLTLLERLTAEQRVVYVLREGLALPYDEIARHLEKRPAACRQIFRRAEMRLIADRHPTIAAGDEHRRLVERFIVAVQSGDAGRIAGMLADDVVWVNDRGPDHVAGHGPVIGAGKVSRGVAGQSRASAAELRQKELAIVDVNGAPAVVFHDHGSVIRLFAFDIRNGRITGIRSVVDRNKLRHLEREPSLFSR